MDRGSIPALRRVPTRVNARNSRNGWPFHEEIAGHRLVERVVTWMVSMGRSHVPGDDDLLMQLVEFVFVEHRW